MLVLLCTTHCKITKTQQNSHSMSCQIHYKSVFQFSSVGHLAPETADCQCVFLSLVPVVERASERASERAQFSLCASIHQTAEVTINNRICSHGDVATKQVPNML